MLHMVPLCGLLMVSTLRPCPGSVVFSAAGIAVLRLLVRFFENCQTI